MFRELHRGDANYIEHLAKIANTKLTKTDYTHLPIYYEYSSVIQYNMMGFDITRKILKPECARSGCPVVQWEIRRDTQIKHTIHNDIFNWCIENHEDYQPFVYYFKKNQRNVDRLSTVINNAHGAYVDMYLKEAEDYVCEISDEMLIKYILRDYERYKILYILPEILTLVVGYDYKDIVSHIKNTILTRI